MNEEPKLCCNCEHYSLQWLQERCDRFIELVNGLGIPCIEARNGGRGYPFSDETDEKTWPCNPLGRYYIKRGGLRP